MSINIVRKKRMATITNTQPISKPEAHDEPHTTYDKGAVVITYLFCVIFCYVIVGFTFSIFRWII